MIEHDCKQEPRIAVLESKECSMSAEIVRAREHIDGSPTRHLELIKAIAAVELKLVKQVSGLKIWILLVMLGAAGNMILQLLRK
jgi:hypothetical protein